MTCARQIVAGEMHYARIPPAYWRARLRMARAMGIDAVSTYVFWNRHESERGSFDFSGENDVAAYVRIAHEEGLEVILRPGPYVCAEWDFGGLPAWLLRDGARVRTGDEKFVEAARAWLRRLGEELAPLQHSRGGPIFAVQLENEYGAFGGDGAYLRELRGMLIEAGFGESAFYTIDQPGDLARGALDDLPIAATFGPGDPAGCLTQLRALRPAQRLLCGEYWAGWFDHWGEPHQTRDDDVQVRDLEWMLAQGASVNIYMLHGGTNFGFWNGANGDEKIVYQPTTTSYDYGAAIDEAGRPRRKYFAFRDAIAKITGRTPPDVPSRPRTIEIPEFVLNESLPLYAALGEPVRSERPMPMELLGQSFGFVLYRTQIPQACEAVLTVDELHDFATILLDGRVIGYLDRGRGESQIEIRAPRGAVLDIFVENCGRINYGPLLSNERKGITRCVTLGGDELRGWRVFSVPMQSLPRGPYSNGRVSAPAFYRGSFTLNDPGDTFLDLCGATKGVVWVNGRAAGRYWNIGPQRTLYVPGVWLRSGENEVTVFEVVDPDGEIVASGRAEPLMA
jgi:beta-galactosidase